MVFECHKYVLTKCISLHIICISLMYIVIHICVYIAFVHQKCRYKCMHLLSFCIS